jgi:hypothetical protein
MSVSNVKKWFKKALKSDEVRAILKKGETILDNPKKFIEVKSK